MDPSPTLFPRTYAISDPGKPAVVMGGSGESRTYRELEQAANRVAHVLADDGLSVGAGVVVVMRNRPELLEVTWGAQRSGLRYTVVNHHLLADEIQYIVDDSGAQALVTAHDLRDVVDRLDLSRITTRLDVDDGDADDGWDDYRRRMADVPDTPVAGEIEGTEMLYSSGTTGRPKGVRKALPATPIGDVSARPVQLAEGSAARYGIDRNSVYLVPAPLYHAAPLVSTMSAHRLGATVVVMERFDPLRCLQLIESHRVTHAQFVPTMFFRMLALPESERARYDLSSLKVAIHAAAPCPIPVKRAMIEWWGPIVQEYYAGTEDIGGTFITSEEWLAHPGSVGRPNEGIAIHILDPDGRELAAGKPGVVYMDGGARFEYHNDPAKTASITEAHGWRTLGDIGYLDGQGYLYLTDRQSYMIVSGGVNIYPQEAEHVLITHPAVADVAVIGVPNAEYGEEVKAVIELRPGVVPGADLSDDLIAWCRERLAAYKCPRTVDFTAALPRDPNGKLYKRRLRDRYWQGRASSIV